MKQMGFSFDPSAMQSLFSLQSMQDGAGGIVAQITQLLQPGGGGSTRDIATRAMNAMSMSQQLQALQQTLSQPLNMGVFQQGLQAVQPLVEALKSVSFDSLSATVDKMKEYWPAASAALREILSPNGLLSCLVTPPALLAQGQQLLETAQNAINIDNIKAIFEKIKALASEVVGMVTEQLQRLFDIEGMLGRVREVLAQVLQRIEGMQGALMQELQNVLAGQAQNMIQNAGANILQDTTGIDVSNLGGISLPF
mmetsp:Transcript_44760/g.96993  ORF Transcript_44760/g.96993 Transcript_44760/m.96993 type:complete len:253 (+) Transcript_44760:120-878(+)